METVSGVSKGQLKGSTVRAERLYNEIIAEIAKEEGLTEKRTETIIRSIFQTFMERVRKGETGISVMNLGSFLMKPKSRNAYEENKLNNVSNEPNS